MNVASVAILCDWLGNYCLSSYINIPKAIIANNENDLATARMLSRQSTDDKL